LVHPHLNTVLTALDDARLALRRATDAIPPDRRSIRPAPERWSAAEVLEHLSLAEAGFTTWISTGVEAARERGLGAEDADRAPLADDIRNRLENRVNRRVAPERAQPKGVLDEGQAWNAILSIEERLRGVLVAADGLALNSVMVDHPTLGPFNIYQWVELMAAHRQRHVAQIDEIAAVVNGDPPA
jgi:hypothetical protein